MTRWLDAVNVVAGAWLMISPWVLGFASEEPAFAASLFLGAGLLAAALGAFTLPRAWEKVDEILVGLVASASPWMLGLQSQPGFRNSTAGVGALAVLAAGLSLIAGQRSRARNPLDGAPSTPSSGGRRCAPEEGR